MRRIESSSKLSVSAIFSAATPICSRERPPVRLPGSSRIQITSSGSLRFGRDRRSARGRTGLVRDLSERDDISYSVLLECSYIVRPQRTEYEMKDTNAIVAKGLSK